MSESNQNSVQISIANLQLLKSIACRGLCVTSPKRGVTLKNVYFLIENATGIPIDGSMKISEVKELALFASAVYNDNGTKEMQKVMDIPMLGSKMKSLLKGNQIIYLN